MIIEREYTAALIQTEIASIENVEVIEESILNEIKINLKTLLEQSNYILGKLKYFKTIKPFDRKLKYFKTLLV